MFGVKLSEKEKSYIVFHQDDSHGDVARALNRLYQRHNRGKRNRMSVYLFRQTSEYHDLCMDLAEKVSRNGASSGKAAV